MKPRRTRDPQNVRPMAPPNYFSRRVQQRLLTLLGLLLLVLILMDRARQPGSWTWLWHVTGQAPPTAAPEVSAVSDPSMDPGPASPEHWPPGVGTSTLRDVRDDSHFRAAEQDVWFTLWGVLRDTPSDELRARSGGPASYLQIYRQTDAYRGQLVDLRGTIRRAHHVTAPENSLGIEQYTQCWLFLDGGPREPIVVYVLDPPATLPEGMTLAEPVQLTGIVYKRWSYQAADRLAVAPVLLAKDLTLLAVPSATAAPPSSPPNRQSTFLLVATTAGAAVLITAVAFRYSAHRYRSTQRKEQLPDTISPPSFDASPEASPARSPGDSTAHADAVDAPSTARSHREPS
jgi:hypothetical protein